MRTESRNFQTIGGDTLWHPGLPEFGWRRIWYEIIKIVALGYRGLNDVIINMLWKKDKNHLLGGKR